MWALQMEVLKVIGTLLFLKRFVLMYFTLK